MVSDSPNVRTVGWEWLQEVLIGEMPRVTDREDAGDKATTIRPRFTSSSDYQTMSLFGWCFLRPLSHRGLAINLLCFGKAPSQSSRLHAAYRFCFTDTLGSGLSPRAALVPSAWAGAMSPTYLSLKTGQWAHGSLTET